MTKEDIDKACNWLNRNLESGYSFGTHHIMGRSFEPLSSFIERFKKVMEE